MSQITKRKSPSDPTPIIVDGQQFDTNSLDPIKTDDEDDAIISPPTSPRKNVPVSRITPNSLRRSSIRKSETKISPLPIRAVTVSSKRITPKPQNTPTPRSTKPPTSDEVKRQKKKQETPLTKVKQIDFNKLSDAEKLKYRMKLRLRYNQLLEQKPWLPMDKYTENMSLQELNQKVQIAQEMVSQNVTVSMLKKGVQLYYVVMGYVLENVFDNIDLSDFKKFGEKAANDLEVFLNEVGDLGIVQKIMKVPWWVKLLGIMALHTIIFVLVAKLVPSSFKTLGSGLISDGVTSAIRDGNFGQLGDLVGMFVGNKSTNTQQQQEDKIYDD